MATMTTMTTELTASQKALLTMTQSAFPIAADPYAAIAAQISTADEPVSADQAYQILRELREQGYVRRLGPVFDSYKLGYVSTLCAVEVPDDQIDEATTLINSFYNITHNYLRANKYNIWFTVIAVDRQQLQSIIAEIEDRLEVQVLQLPAIRLFKIRVDFNFSDHQRMNDMSQQKVTYPDQVIATPLSTADKALIRIAQDDSFAGRYPYADLAQTLSNELV